MTIAGPAAFFERHPNMYRLSVASASSTLAYSARRAVTATTRGRRLSYGLLIAVIAVELIGLMRVRPKTAIA